MKKEIFNKHLSTLIEEEFKFSPEWGKWERKQENRTERINISYNEYPGSFYIKGMSVSISFYTVESILKQHYRDEGLEYNEESKTIHDGLSRLNDINYSTLEIEISDDATFETVKEELRKIIAFGALPFFKEYSSLESVANLLAELKPQEVVPYIQGAQLFVKTILILKLANHHRYEEKKTEFREVLAQQAEKKEVYKQQLDIFDFIFSS